MNFKHNGHKEEMNIPQQIPFVIYLTVMGGVDPRHLIFSYEEKDKNFIKYEYRYDSGIYTRSWHDLKLQEKEDLIRLIKTDDNHDNYYDFFKLDSHFKDVEDMKKTILTISYQDYSHTVYWTNDGIEMPRILDDIVRWIQNLDFVRS